MNLSTISLIVQILFYITLCTGVIAQVRGAYKWHDRLQAPVVILNIFFILFVMIPTFRAVVPGNIPGGLSEVPTLVTAIHGTLGLIAQGLAIYVMLAGFKILPRKIGVLRYWMWATFAAWTITVLFGVGVYIIFYTGDSGEAGVAEHDASLVVEEEAQEEAAAPAVEDEETVAEHDAEPIGEEATEEVAEQATEEAIAEHDEEAVVAEATDEVTVEAVAEHDEEAVVEEATEEAVSEHDAAAVDEAEAPDSGDTTADDGTETTDEVVDEHAEDVVDESGFTGETGFVAWEELIQTSAEGPGVRYDHGMEYSESRDRIYLFGGQDGSQDYNDVWELEEQTVTWRRVAANSPTAPPARSSMVTMLDNEGQNLYIVAGHTQAGQNFNDVWKLDLNTEIWEEITPAGPGPEPRYGNPGGNVAGNLVMTHGFGETRYDDTWRFNISTQQWENITPGGALPLRRCLFAATPTGQAGMVIHGGCAAPFGECFLDDAWVLDTATNAWREVLTDVKPAGRQHQTLVDIPGANKVIMFGGQDASQSARDDLWFLNLNSGSWQLVIGDGPAPSARYNHAAVWVPRISGMVMYGGRNESGGLSDLWLGGF